MHMRVTRAGLRTEAEQTSLGADRLLAQARTEEEQDCRPGGGEVEGAGFAVSLAIQWWRMVAGHA